ncbi:MAG: hypothetical protein PHV82_01860 [Victivallaceae bacterium]|nr:hypothetical protein [Victivallaceae bacterium]
MKLLKSVSVLLGLICFSGLAMVKVRINDISDNGTSSPCKVGITRSGNFKLAAIPQELEDLQTVSVPRGNSGATGKGFSFKVNVPVTVYLFVDKRCQTPELDGWEKTKMTAIWKAYGKSYQDIIYVKNFPGGTIIIPGNPPGAIPHMAAVEAQ